MHFGPARFLPDAALWRWLRKEARSGAFRCTKDLQEAFRELGTLCLADMAATTASAESQALARHFADQLFLMAGTMPVHTADLAISGRDLIAAGIPQRALKGCCPCFFPVFRTEVFPIPLKRSREQRTSGGKRKKKKDPRLNVSI